MNDIITYRIEVSGRIDKKDLTSKSPLRIKMLNATADSISFSINTDQSGLIGMMRYLNGLGLVLLAVNCEDCEG
jgi:hypothetical protein